MLSAINLENKGGYTLRNLGHINIILGKNGCGKSTLLKGVEQALTSNKARNALTRYVTPERAGFLQYDAGIENNIVGNADWLSDSRRTNQYQSFKQQSVANFRRLETMVLREIEKDTTKRADVTFTFDSVVSSVNKLLDNVEMRREGATFKLYSKTTQELVNPQQISSGESELISLAIECLLFEKEAISEKENILFLDEPDVHLHPDLQAQFGRFIKDELKKSRVLIATHSTAFVGAFTDYEDVSIAFISKHEKTFAFEKVTEIYRRVLPVFGAHPLSNLFNEAPILLVEGEDDERVWQQAVRTSRGKLKLYPCHVDSVDQLHQYETEVQKILTSVYDKPKAYSCRDGDGIHDPITDLPPITRFRLNCMAAENLLVTDEVLALLGTDWNTLEGKIESWLEKNKDHKHFNQMLEFKTKGFPRKEFNLKEIRNDLMGLLATNKSWEIAVGQTIAAIVKSPVPSEHSLQNYLGSKLIGELFS